MIAVLRQLIMNTKSLIVGATTTSINGLVSAVPAGMMDMSFLTDTTSLLGFSVPTFLLYLFFIDD